MRDSSKNFGRLLEHLHKLVPETKLHLDERGKSTVLQLLPIRISECAMNIIDELIDVR